MDADLPTLHVARSASRSTRRRGRERGPAALGALVPSCGVSRATPSCTTPLRASAPWTPSARCSPSAAASTPRRTGARSWSANRPRTRVYLHGRRTAPCPSRSGSCRRRCCRTPSRCATPTRWRGAARRRAAARGGARGLWRVGRAAGAAPLRPDRRRAGGDGGRRARRRARDARVHPLPHRFGEAEAAEAAEATPPPPAAPPIDCEEDEGRNRGRESGRRVRQFGRAARDLRGRWRARPRLRRRRHGNGGRVGARRRGRRGGGARRASPRAPARCWIPRPRTLKLLERAQVPTYVLPDWLTERPRRSRRLAA